MCNVTTNSTGPSGTGPSTSSPDGQTNTTTPVPFVPLSTELYPSHYEVTLLTSLDHFLFDGVVRVDFDIQSEDTELSSFRMNSFELDIHSAYITIHSPTSTYCIPLSFNVEESTESVTFLLPQSQKLNLKTLKAEGTKISTTVAFTGELNDKMLGFYRSEYTKADGTQGYMAGTQFEPVYARRSFPCFDEPGIKSKFTINMFAPSHLQVVSNEMIDNTKKSVTVQATEDDMSKLLFSSFYLHKKDAKLDLESDPASTFTSLIPDQSTNEIQELISLSTRSKNPAKKDGNATSGSDPTPVDYLLHRYETTPVLSSYLIAYVVGEFETISATHTTLDGREIPVTVMTPPKKIAYGAFALEVAVKSIDFFEKWFNIPYPFSKCDNIAFPDFSAGAMENAGCILYRDTAVLVDERNTSVDTLQAVALTVSHEISHQWFGNIVTMKWWNDLWLNEGFATWSEYSCVDALYPHFNIWQQYAQGDLSSAFKLDALTSTHPVEAPVSHPDEIDEIFDAISYLKGCAVVRMIADFLGAEQFQTGIRTYMNKFMWKNASTLDLWTTLEEVSGQPVVSMMSAWTKKDGFPVITIEEENVAINGTKTASTQNYIISQERFFATPHSALLSQKKLEEGSKEANSPILENAIEDNKWLVPLHTTDSTCENTHKIVLNDLSQTFSLQEILGRKSDEEIESPSYIILNDSMATLTRINYPLSWWNAIIHDIGLPSATRPKVFDSPVTRMYLLTDSVALSTAGYIPVTVSLRLLHAIATQEDEKSAVVWNGIASAVANLRVLTKTGSVVVEDSDISGTNDATASASIVDELKKSHELRRNLSNYISPLFQRGKVNLPLGDDFWSDSSDSSTLTKEEAHAQSLLRVCFSDIYEIFPTDITNKEACNAVEAFYNAGGYLETATKEQSQTLHPDVRSNAYAIAIAADEEKYVPIIVDMARKTTLTEEQERLICSLANVTSPKMTKLIMDMFFIDLSLEEGAEKDNGDVEKDNEGTSARAQDIPFAIRGFAGNEDMLPYAWYYLKKEWNTIIYPKFGRTSGLRYLLGLLGGFTHKNQCDDVEEFFKTHEYKGAEMFLEQTLEKVHGNVFWIQKAAKDLENFFEEHNKKQN